MRFSFIHLSNMLTDKDKIDFGAHKSKELANVPCYYLLWLNQQDWFLTGAKHKALKQYIDDNMDVLAKEQSEKEKKDVIFRRKLNDYKYKHR